MIERLVRLVLSITKVSLGKAYVLVFGSWLHSEKVGLSVYLHILNLCVPPFPRLSVAFLFVPIIFIPQILCSPLFYTVICLTDFFFFSFYRVYHSSEEYCFLEPDAWIQILTQILPSWQCGSYLLSLCLWEAQIKRAE